MEHTWLADESCRALTIGTPGLFATTLSERVVSVASLSRAYGMSGLRVGWFLASDRQLNQVFLAAKEQMTMCGRLLDEEIACRVYCRCAQELPQGAAAVRRGVDIAKFYATLNGMHATMVGPGHWFEKDDRLIRIGFGRPLVTP